MKKLRTVLIWLLFIVAVFGVTWLIVIAWWQITHRVVTLDDTILYLGLLPILLTAILLIAGLIRKRKKKTSAPDAGLPEQTTPPVLAEPLPTTLIAGAWAITSAGTNALEYAETLRERSIRPTPDKRLTDNQGFPVLAGRMEILKTASILTWLAENAEENSDAKWRESFIRTLALLNELLSQTIDEWPFLPDTSEQHNASQHATLTLRGMPIVEDKVDAPLLVHVATLLPEHFDEGELKLIERFLKNRIKELRAKFAHVEIVAASNDTRAISLVEQFRARNASLATPQALLLLAADSSICQSVVDAWSFDDQLFAIRKPNGLMPGEGAFGVLYANQAATSSALTEPLCRQAPTAQESAPALDNNVRHRNDSGMMRAVQAALTLAGTDGDDIVAVACDADHRTNRALECVNAMVNATPHLDAVLHRSASNEACGHLGAASALSALVAGATQVSISSAPLLVLTLSHVSERSATVLLPYTEASA